MIAFLVLILIMQLIYLITVFQLYIIEAAILGYFGVIEFILILFTINLGTFYLGLYIWNKIVGDKK